MRSTLRSAFVALVALLALGGVTAGAAQAEAPRWFDNGVALEAGHSENVTVSGPDQILSSRGTGFHIECEKGVSGSGSVTGGTPGTGKLTLTLTGCKINISGCDYVESKGKPNGTIVTESLKTKLETFGGAIHDALEGETAESVVMNFDTGTGEVEGKVKGTCGLLAVHNHVTGVSLTKFEGSTLLQEGEGTLQDTSSLLGRLEWNGRQTLALTNGHTLTAG